MIKPMPTQYAHFDAANYLQSDEDIIAYLNEALAGGETQVLLSALGDITRAQNMSKPADKTGFTRQGLLKALSGKSNPSFDMVMKLTKELGFQISVNKTDNQHA